MDEKEKQAIRAWAYKEGFEEGMREAVSIQYTFSNAYAKELVKVKCELRELKLENYELRTAASRVQEKP